MVEHQNAPQSSVREATEIRKTIAEGAPAGPLDRAASRRRLLRAGAIGAPVIASLLSRPAIATSYSGGNTSARCTTSGYGHIVSAGTTVGLSPTSVAGPEDCAARSPGFWAQQTNQDYSTNADFEEGTFHSLSLPTRTPLTSMFPSSSSYGVPTSTNQAAYDNLLPHQDFSAWGYLTGNNSGGHSNDWVKHLVAIYLDVLSNNLPVLLGNDLDKLFDASVNGTIVMIGTEQWDQADARDFIAQFYGSV